MGCIVKTVRVLAAFACLTATGTREVSAQSLGSLPETIDEPPAASSAAGVGDFTEAAAALERVAPTLPPERALTAWGIALRLRRALADEAGVGRDLDALLSVSTGSDALRSRAWAWLEATFSVGDAAADVGERLREAAARLGDRPLDVAVRSRVARARVARDDVARRRLAVEALAQYLAAHPEEALGAERELPDPREALHLERRRAEQAERRRQRRSGSTFGRMTEAGYDPPNAEGWGIRDDDDLLGGTVDDRARQGAAAARFLVLEVDVAHDAPAPLAVPAFTTRGAFDRWSEREVTPWVHAWRRALDVWAIAAARLERTGVASMEAPAMVLVATRYLDFVEQLRGPPPPPEALPMIVMSPGYGHEGWRPFLAIAEVGFEQCVRSASWRRQPLLVARCGLALAAMDFARHPPADEVTPALSPGPAAPPATASPAPR